MTQQAITFIQQQALMLMQSMLGVISPNFRMVSIANRDDIILVQVVLERESIEDRSELEDCMSEFEALQSSLVDYDFDVVISDAELEWPTSSSIVIYRRREA